MHLKVLCFCVICFALTIHPATADLVLDYRFGTPGGSVAANSGTLGAAADATISGSTAIGTGGQPFMNGGFLSVSANGGLMSSPEAESIDNLNAFSLSFWMKSNETRADWQDMMGDVDAGPPNQTDGWNLMMMANGRLRLRVWQEGDAGLISEFDSPADTVPATSVWHHYALVANHLTEVGTRDITVDYYKDGALLNNVVVNSAFVMGNSDKGFEIGNTMWDAELLADYGRVQLFDEALDAAGVAAVYNATLIPEPSSLSLLIFGMLALRGRGLCVSRDPS